MRLLNGKRFTGKNGEHYELTIAPILKNTFVDDMINLTNKDTGVVERMNYLKFSALYEDRSYKYVKSRVDVVIEPGKVASGEVYFDIKGDNMYTTEGFLDGIEGVDEVIRIYDIAVVYEDDKVVQSFRPVGFLKRFHIHEICNINGEKYITNGVQGDHVELRKLDNIKESKTIDTYDKAVSIDSFVPIRIGYAFTLYGLIPVLHLYIKETEKAYNYAVINEKYLIILPAHHVFKINKTLLTLPIKSKNDIVKVAKAGVEMFAEWAYDYRSMLPAIENVFGKE